ncbi:hypothetical protein QUB40_00880 [Microcoleus sp. AT9_A2]|uniref:hypothetical protein n=1 Tax=Microcoleus sp. AT9_A2 TaxID=2818624 RepID=UPI002FD022C6
MKRGEIYYISAIENSENSFAKNRQSFLSHLRLFAVKKERSPLFRSRAIARITYYG